MKYKGHLTDRYFLLASRCAQLRQSETQHLC